MKKSGLLFGYLCLSEEKYNGQKIRTNNIKELLSKYLNFNLSYYDTLEFRKNPLSIIPALFKIPKYGHIFIILAHNGVKLLLPLIVTISYFFNKKIYFIAIGGWLPEVISQNKYLKFFLKRIDIIFLQSDLMKNKIIEDVYPANVELLPNFKFYTFIREFEKKKTNLLKVVYISRVGREKGLDSIEYLAKEIVAKDLPIYIDLYGPIAPEDEGYLREISQISNNVKYCGIAKGDDIFSTLVKYDIMIFPTHHMTEGFPGVILDAFVTGLPIIASNWDYAAEFIKPEFGFIFDHNKPEEALNYLLKINNDPEMLLKMQKESYKNRNKYSVEFIASSLKAKGL